MDRVGNHYGTPHRDDEKSGCYIKRVTWLNGFGLFVRRSYHKREIVTEYAGVLMDVLATELDDTEATSHYRSICTIQNTKRVISGDRIPIDGYGLAQFTNHGFRPNVEFVVYDVPTNLHPHVGIVLRALREIHPHEELIVNYGRHYFHRHELTAVPDDVRLVHHLYQCVQGHLRGTKWPYMDVHTAITSLRQIALQTDICALLDANLGDLLFVVCLCILQKCTVSIVVVYPLFEETRVLLETILSMVHDPKTQELFQYCHLTTLRSTLPPSTIVLEAGCGTCPLCLPTMHFLKNK